MPKTIEPLKRIPSVGYAFHEKIADTYFVPKKSKKQKPAPAKHLKITPTLIVFAFFFIFFLYLSFRHTPSAPSLPRAGAIMLFRDGAMNKADVRTFYFGGEASAQNAFDKKIIVLRNPKKYNPADFSIDFKNPLNITGKSLFLAARGKTGGEKINIILKDANNKSFKLDTISLTSDWSDQIIKLDLLKNELDMQKMSQLRIDFGCEGESPGKTDSLIEVTLFIKELTII